MILLKVYCNKNTWFGSSATIDEHVHKRCWICCALPVACKIYPFFWLVLGFWYTKHGQYALYKQNYMNEDTLNEQSLRGNEEQWKDNQENILDKFRRMERFWYTSIHLASPLLYVYFFQSKRACTAALSVISYSFPCFPHHIVKFWFACLCLTDFQRCPNCKRENKYMF